MMISEMPLKCLVETKFVEIDLDFFIFVGLLLRPPDLRVIEVLPVVFVVHQDVSESYLDFALLELSELLVDVHFFRLALFGPKKVGTWNDNQLMLLLQ